MVLPTVSEPGHEKKKKKAQGGILGYISCLFVFQMVVSSSYMFQKRGPMLLAGVERSGLPRLFPSEKSPCIVQSQLSPCHP